MKRFEYYFVNGSYDVPLIYQRGFNQLVSYASSNSAITKVCNHASRTSVNKIFIDSGAYSAFRSNQAIEVDKYIEYINNNDERLNPTIWCQLDHIPGTQGSNNLDAEIKTYQNLLYMYEKINPRHKLCPVHHFGESMNALDKLLQFTLQHKEIEYFCLARSGVYQAEKLYNYYDECFNKILKINPDLKVHGLGIGDWNLLRAYPFYSSDSSTHLSLAINGCIFIPTDDKNTKTSIAISNNKNSDKDPSNFNNLSAEHKDRVRKYIAEKGYDIDRLAEDHAYRVTYNSDFLMDYFENVYVCEYKPKEVYSLFDINKEYETANRGINPNLKSEINIKSIEKELNEEDAVLDEMFNTVTENVIETLEKESEELPFERSNKNNAVVQKMTDLIIQNNRIIQCILQVNSDLIKIIGEENESKN